MTFPAILHTKQCPHCGSNLVESELLLPEACEPGAFHSRLLGILGPDNKVNGWRCPDCLTPIEVSRDTEPRSQSQGNGVNSLESRFESLEQLVITLAECVSSTESGTEYNINGELEWYHRAVTKYT